MKADALLLTPEVPFPTIGGGALRTASLFEFLARRFHLDVITFRQPGEPDPRSFFPLDRIRLLSVLDLPFHSKAALPRALRNLNRLIYNRPPLLDRFSGFEAAIAQAVSGKTYQLAMIEHFWCAPYEAELRSHAQHLILDLHNIESAWHRSVASSSSSIEAILHRRFAAAYETRERRLLPRFDQLLVTSEKDRDRVRSLANGGDALVFPNSIPWMEQPRPAKREEILFTGNLEYHPNRAAILFFQNEIWPKLRARWPKLIWTIAGKNSEVIENLIRRDERIELVRRMDDAVARIAEAKVVVVPLLSGSGTRIKILEAWAAGTPIVSTTVGAEGLEAVSGKHLILADQPAEFARAVSELLASPEDSARLATHGRQLYEKSYTCERAWERLRALKGV